MKNTILHKSIIVFAAFCLFINGIGFSNYLFITKDSANNQEFFSKSKNEKKVTALVSTIDLEESNFEIGDETDLDEEDDSNEHITFLKQQLLGKV